MARRRAGTNLRIAVVGSRGVQSSYGGIERGLAAICPRLVAMGYEVDVYGEQDAPGGIYDGVGVIKMPAIPGKFTENISRSALSMVHALRGDYDVIHLVAVGPGVLSALPYAIGVPVVVSVHGLDWQRDTWGNCAKMALKLAERAIVAFSTAITVVSGELQMYYNRTYGVEVQRIPNGIDLVDGPVDPDLLSELGVEADDYILFAGRLVPEKGAHELVEAFAKVQTRKRLLIAGGGRYDLDYVEKLKSMDRTGRVIFAGHIEGPVLEAAFKGCSLYVLPSHIEGLSMSLLEAMGYARPVLVSDIAENLEVVGDCGYPFRVGDAEDLAVRMAQVLADPSAAAATGRRGLDRARSNYSWDSVARLYACAFEAASRGSSIAA
jgi:glycosyltransferase involved in cell wall biosynthesis